MKIKKISSIKNYKSFLDFSWAESFEEDSKRKSLGNLSVFFGENGSGKSSICKILKDFSHKPDSQFKTDSPTFVKLELEDGPVVYKGKNWSKSARENDFLFFDSNFVNANVHTNGTRTNEKEAHAQNSGDLIVRTDEKAIQLEKAQEKASET